MEELKDQLINCSNEVLEIWTVARKAEVAAELLSEDYFNEKEDCMKLVFYDQAGVVCSIVNDYNRELSIKLQALLDRIDNAIDCFQGEFHRGGVVINGFFICCIQHDI